MGQVILKSFTPFSEVSHWHCGNPQFGAARAWQPLPSNATACWPWECCGVASFWQHDKSLNQKPGLTPPHTSEMRQGEQAGKGMPSHRVAEVMVWKCTMSLSVFCYVPARWREKTGKRGSWWNDYIVAERGRGAPVLNSWQKPSLFNTVLQCPVESSVKSDEEHWDALRPSLVPLVVFHKKNHTILSYSSCMPPQNFLHVTWLDHTTDTRYTFKILTRLSGMLKTHVSWCKSFEKSA